MRAIYALLPGISRRLFSGHDLSSIARYELALAPQLGPRRNTFPCTGPLPALAIIVYQDDFQFKAARSSSYSSSFLNLSEPIRKPDKLRSWPLVRIRRQEYLLTETGAEYLNAPGKVECLKRVETLGVQNHAPLFV